MQTFDNATLGKVSFELTWSWRTEDGSRRLHLGLMPGGAYAHVPNGLPITNRQDILDAIWPIEHQQQALAWYDRQHAASMRPSGYVRKVFPESDGSWRYLDNGEPVTRVEDFYSTLHGPVLEEAIRWFQSQQQRYQDGQPPLERPPGPNLDQQLIELLDQHPEGLSPAELAQGLDQLPSVLVPILTNMREAGQITAAKKRYYLPHHLEAAMAPED